MLLFLSSDNRALILFVSKYLLLLQTGITISLLFRVCHNAIILIKLCSLRNSTCVKSQCHVFIVFQSQAS